VIRVADGAFERARPVFVGALLAYPFGRGFFAVGAAYVLHLIGLMRSFVQMLIWMCVYVSFGGFWAFLV